jgi:FtsH-binding integral membrane protein
MTLRESVNKYQVPIAIVLLWGVAIWAGGLLVFETNMTDEQILLGRIIAIGFFFCALMLTIGYFANRAGYTQEGLDKEADDILSGKKNF